MRNAQAKQAPFTNNDANKLMLLFKLEKALQESGVCEGGFDMSVGNINYWFLETIPDLLQDLADETTTAPAGMTLPEWKDKLEYMVFLFREANEDTCTKFPGNSPTVSPTDREAYCDACKTEALSLFNQYFWYLDA